jgi:hypothetical protein
MVLDLILYLRFVLWFVDLALLVMRYLRLDITFIVVLLNIVAMCRYYCVVMVVPLNKGNYVEIIVMSWSWEMFKVGVALPGRVDTRGVTIMFSPRVYHSVSYSHTYYSTDDSECLIAI